MFMLFILFIISLYYLCYLLLLVYIIYYLCYLLLVYIIFWRYLMEWEGYFDPWTHLLICHTSHVETLKPDLRSTACI